MIKPQGWRYVRRIFRLTDHGGLDAEKLNSWLHLTRGAVRQCRACCTDIGFLVRAAQDIASHQPQMAGQFPVSSP
jgi:hypothetical protein